MMFSLPCKKSIPSICAIKRNGLDKTKKSRVGSAKIAMAV